jgi:hypothetical protein
MAIRPFGGVQTVGAASQPVFGTTLTAAVVTPAQATAGNKFPATAPAVTIAVTSTAGFVQNDRVLVGPKANFTVANRALLDTGTVSAVVDGTHLKVVGLTQNHASTDYVVLCEVCDHVAVIPVTNAGAIYLGTDSTVSSTDTSVFAGGSPQYWATDNPTLGKGQGYQTDQYWLFGATPGDTFIARFDQY